MSEQKNIAAAMGGWSVRHRAVAIVGWLVFVVVAMTIGSMAGQRQMTQDQYATGDSARAIQIHDAAGLSNPAGEMILVTSTAPVTSPEARAAVTDLVGRLRITPDVTEVVDPYDAGLVSADGHSVLVRVSMSGDPMTAADRVQPILDAVAATRSAHPAVRIDEFGDGSANKWFNDTIMQGLPARRVDRRTAGARHPARGVRRVPGRRPARRARAHVVPGGQRGPRPDQPPAGARQLRPAR